MQVLLAIAVDETVSFVSAIVTLVVVLQRSILICPPQPLQIPWNVSDYQLCNRVDDTTDQQAHY